ncbi:hypothetical protein [Haploplasma modicum]|uniref:hypothetical protein n=1 Tax=Haploplasma modicum TaxID=2150 RepID=UPI00138AD774|nr:hypothetical protein [Haploplasma modicum]
MLLIFNLNVFKEATDRFLEIFDFKELKNFFQLYVDKNTKIFEDFSDSISDSIDNIQEVLSDKEQIKEALLTLLLNFITLFFNFLNYFLNIGVNILFLLMIFFNETFNATNLNIKYSKSSLLWIKFQKFLSKVKSILKNIYKKIVKWLNERKRKILLIFLIVLFSKGVVYQVLVEIIIFLVTYISAVFRFETYIAIMDIAKAILIFLLPYIESLSKGTIIVILIFIIFIRAFNRANYKLKKNHERLKIFAKDRLTQTTFINGAPGVGKTLLNVSLSLASEENFIDELELMMHEYQAKHPYLNFANIRTKDIDQEHQEYIDIYNFLLNRSSYLISNFAIYSPYFDEYSKIFDFNFMRKNIKSDIYALEEYTIISISELDKEYNSHDDMKIVGADGAATFFSTVSHDLKRTAKIFCDYQLKDQVPLRIRGNSEYFLTVKSRKKKYPVLLYLYYYPFILMDKLVSRLIFKYETKRKTINKNTKRKSLSKYKRNDYTLVYGILRSLQFQLNKIKNFFDKYWYFRITSILSEEDGGKGKSVAININLCDLKLDDQQLYDSTFLSHAYEQKKNTKFKDLDKFTSITPSIEELTKCNSRFYNKINGIKNEETEKKNNRGTNDDDDFITI